MISMEEMKIFNKYENEILEVVDNQDEYTRSDLQGRVGAIVMNIYNEGKKAQEENKDIIKISWNIEDVKEVDPGLTDDQCREVLRLAKQKHDANIGINWEVLQMWADHVRDTKE